MVVKSGISSLLHLKTWLGGVEFATFPADGIIVAVPSGSTAYSLSAGGPLVAPSIQVMLITPVCPHTLSARPMIVPADETIDIEIESSDGQVICTVDGVYPFEIQTGDHITAKRSEYITKLIIPEQSTFYRKVRVRYLYGERQTE